MAQKPWILHLYNWRGDALRFWSTRIRVYFHAEHGAPCQFWCLPDLFHTFLKCTLLVCKKQFFGEVEKTHNLVLVLCVATSRLKKFKSQVQLAIYRGKNFGNEVLPQKLGCLSIQRCRYHVRCHVRCQQKDLEMVKDYQMLVITWQSFVENWLWRWVLFEVDCWLELALGSFPWNPNSLNFGNPPIITCCLWRM